MYSEKKKKRFVLNKRIEEINYLTIEMNCFREEQKTEKRIFSFFGYFVSIDSHPASSSSIHLSSSKLMRFGSGSSLGFGGID